MAEKAVEARVTGRVQGVGFRVWAAGEARALGLKGWIRNEPDGAVSALVSGEETAVETMLETLRRGPPAASVDDVHTQSLETAELPDGFRVLR